MADNMALDVCGERSMRCSYVVQLSRLALLLLAARASADDLDLPVDRIAGGQPAKMMQQYWLRQVERAGVTWKERYEQLKTPEQIAAYQQAQRATMLKAIGGLPERTPLSPEVTSVTKRDGYRVEKITFQSQPHHYVTALLFLPDSERFASPYPGVLVPCGHAMQAKAYPEYQSMGALLALNGMATLVFDPIDQGERGQYLGEGGWPKLAGTRAHSMVGVAAILLGQNTARFEIWDAMRAVDYLQSRPEVDAERIGCTGNSGGGTQTSYLMTLDDRIKVAAPSCYICGFQALLHTIGPQDAEQNIFGQVGQGLDHTDYLLTRAPMPILLCAATKDFFDIQGTWDVFRFAKRMYTRMGHAERVALMENDAGHNYNTQQREAVARWMSRWLRGKDEAITEPALTLLNDKEVLCTPEGAVMKLAGARSIYDLNQDYENELAERRTVLWKQANLASQLREVRRLAGIRELRDIPAARVEMLQNDQHQGYQIEQLVLTPEDGIALPALRFVPDKVAGRVVLYLHESGKSADAGTGGPIHKLVAAGDTVLAVDLRGIGQTQSGGPPKPGSGPSSDFKGVNLAYLLGRSYVGCRAEDILACARLAAEPRDGKSPPEVHLIAIGQVGVPALHAAALEPQLFATVQISRSLRSWSDIIHGRLSQNQAINAVHAALTNYDLPDLASALGKKLTITEPLDPRGRPLTP
jgi:cephalosporin-C deacetylase-like acetyl esterase